jgi:arylsulfatase
VRHEPAVLLERLDQIGGPDSYPHFNAGWAWALDTPFQWFKQVASHLGGTRNPLVVSWPTRITDRGGLRSQFSHVADVAPTILEAAGIPAPAVVNGVAQQPLDGTSLVYSFADASAPSRRRTQYFEVFGNRALYHEGWMASAFHGRLPWILLSNWQRSFDDDGWELYHLDADFSQASDLAKREPEKLRRMQDLFLAEAARNQVLPLQDATRPAGLPDPSAGRTTFTFHRGAVGIAEWSAPHVIGRSHTITAEIDVPASGARGVLVAEGGVVAGWSLYLDAEGRPAYAYNLFGVEQTTLIAPGPLPPGPTTVGIVFDYDGGGYGRGASLRLLVDGLPVAEARLHRTVPFFFSIDESFDVGLDSGSPAGPYRPSNAFSGELRRVVVELR